MDRHQAIVLLGEVEVGRFVDERCVVGEGIRGHSRSLYASYWAWARKPGAPREARHVLRDRFNECLRWRGFRQVFVSGLRYWDGIDEIEIPYRSSFPSEPEDPGTPLGRIEESPWPRH